MSNFNLVAIPLSIIQTLAGLGMGLLLHFYYRDYAYKHLKLWAWAFFWLSISSALFLADQLGSIWRMHSALRSASVVAANFTLYIYLGFTLLGSLALAGTRFDSRRSLGWVIAASATAAFPTALASFSAGYGSQFKGIVQLAMPAALQFMVYLLSGLIIFRRAKSVVMISGRRFLAYTFIFFACLELLRSVAAFAVNWSDAFFYLLHGLSMSSAFLTCAFGASCILLLLEHKQERLEKSASLLARLTHYDSSTGLPNAQLLERRLGNLLAQFKDNSRAIAVFVVEASELTRLRNTLGNNVAEKAMIECTRRLYDVTDGLAASTSRIGENQFAVVVVDNKSHDWALLVAQKIISKLSPSISVADANFSPDPHVGMSLSETDGNDAEQLIRAARIACESSHQLDNGPIACFTPGLITQGQALLSSHAQLRSALLHDEFELHYQPIFSAHTLTPVSMEALIRWNHPTLGVRQPNDFLPAVEDMGLSAEIDLLTLHRACKKARAWHLSGQHHLNLSINISSTLFGSANFIKDIEIALESYSLSPESVMLEITAQVALKDLAKSKSTLIQLARMGVGVALDNFGTGYSSLSLLRDLQISTIKIDRSFTQQIMTNSRTRAIVDSLINLAKSLKIDVIVVGVETEDQLSYFMHNKIDKLQGNYLGAAAALIDAPPHISRN